MQAVLVDTNVILDIVTRDPAWWRWSLQQLERLSLQYRLWINVVVYSELAIAYDRIEKLDAMLEDAQFELREIPREAGFLAGRVFLSYRGRAGAKTGVLPDFYIGAHAAVMNLPLLTRDSARYRTYFPRLTLIAP